MKVLKDERFRVEVLAATENPQQLIYKAMHQDYSEGFVFDEAVPEETRAGEIAVKRLLVGERGHWGCTEHPQISFNVGWFPHSVMQQARTHRIGCCLSGETLVSFGHPSLSDGQIYYRKSIEELASLWHKGRAHQQGSADAAYMQRMISSRTLLRANEETGCIEQTQITNIYCNGVRHVFRFYFEGGYNITATKDHSVFTPNGWLTFGDLKEGDSVYVSVATSRKVEPTQPTLSVEELAREQWQPVRGYEWYEVSDLGRVRSRAPRKHRGVLRYPQLPKLKKQCESTYLYVSLSKADGSGSKRFNVHSLVLSTFKGEAEEGQVARHLNGNHYDNRLSNLEWGSEAENAEDRVTHDVTRRARIKPATFIGSEDCGMQETYDLEVKGPFHNFVANHIIVHNSFDVQSMRYSGERISKAAVGELPVEEVFYLRPVGKYHDRQGKHYLYTEEARQADLIICKAAAELYKVRTQEQGFSEEHARGLLPFDYRQHFVVSFTLRSALHFMDLRAKADAQEEIQAMCEMMWPKLKEWAPQICEYYETTRLHKARLAP